MRPSRLRTLAHMHALVAVAACGKEAAKNPEAAAPDAGTPPPEPLRPPDLAYTVVDPLPAPTYTPDLPPHIRPQVTLSGPPKNQVLTVVVPPPLNSSANHFKYADSEPVIYGGLPLKVERAKDGTVTVTVSVYDGDTMARSASVSLRANYDRGPTTIMVSASWNLMYPTAPPEFTVSQY